MFYLDLPASGKPLKMLAYTAIKNGGLWVLVKVSIPLKIKRWQSIRWRTGRCNTWIQRQILIQNGIDPDNDVEIVPMKVALMGE